MGKKKAKNKRKSELKIIFFIILVAAALFIVSTYAWFSTQRNVSITNLKGTVEVAEGLEISLDAKTWSNGIVLGDEEGQLDIIEDAYPSHRNIEPVEMLPVSTMGSVADGKSLLDMQMYRGTVENSVKLKDIISMNEKLALDSDKTKHDSEDAAYPGYFAFDIFLKNDSKSDLIADTLQLNYDSSVQITETDKKITGLQNTVRVAFAKYGGTSPEDGVWNGVADSMAEQQTILDATGVTNQDVYLTDIAIWEPNSSDHAEYIVNNNNKITWDATGASKYVFDLGDDKSGFKVDTQMPTYALLDAAKGKTIENIYDWSGTNSTTLAKQMVLQTTKTSEEDYTIAEGVQDLISTSSTDSKEVLFKLAPNSVNRLRVYVWLEGQDVDCINYASHGGGVTVNIGLVKGSTENTHGEVDEEPEGNS